MSFTADSLREPLDWPFPTLAPEVWAFFKSQIGIDNDEALKQHVLKVQAQAYETFPYPCIRRFNFMKLRISLSPAYQRALALQRDKPDAILLDIGCCLGADVRKAVADGFPVENIVASDLYPEFWDQGHALFKSTPSTFPACFIAGDVFSPAHLEPRPPLYNPPSSPAPSLSTLTSLSPLHGHVSIIYAGSFFHLFDEEKQLQVARSLAGLLSSLRGSVIFGAHVGLPEKGYRKRGEGDHPKLFCHSPKSWKEMWVGPVFEEGRCHFKTLFSRGSQRGRDVLVCGKVVGSSF